MEEKNNKGGQFMTVAGAVAVGVVIGLLLADKDTRTKLKNVFADLAAELGDILNDNSASNAPVSE